MITKKIIKRHSDGSVTTVGEAAAATCKGALKGIGIGVVAGFAILGVMAVMLSPADEEN